MSGAPPIDPDDEHLARLEAERERRARFPSLSPTPPAAKARKAGLWGGLVVLAAVVFKSKGLLVVVLSKLKFILGGLKFLKLGQVLTTGGTMALTIWVYANLFGFPYALGFVLLIFLHEMGHAAAIRMHGLEAGAPVFIPFVGAMIAMKKMPPNVRVEAEVAIAGPIAGGLAAGICWLLGLAFESPLLVALAYSGFFLNLINLLPVSPLDGGRVVAALSRWIWIPGLAVAIVMAVRTANPLLWAIVLLGGFRAVASFRGKGDEAPGYYEIRPVERWAIGIGYFTLAALLGAGVAALMPPAPGA